MKKYRWRPPEWLKVAACIGLVLTLHSIAVRADYPEIKEAKEKVSYTLPDTKTLPISEPKKDEKEPDIGEVDYIEKTALSYGLKPEIVKAIIKVESGGDEKAVGDGCNSYGLMQIQPKWHESRMERLGVTDLLDGEQNVRVGCDLLAELLRKYGSYDSALTAYNCGFDDGSREYAGRVKEQING